MRNRLVGALALMSLLCLALPASAASGSYVVKDANGNIVTMGAVVNSGVTTPAHVETDSAGNDATDTANHAVRVNVVAGGSTTLPTGAATAANQTATQAAAGSSSAQATGVQGVSGALAVGTTDTNGGAIGTGYSPPTGGSGFLGYLSGIYHALTNTLTVSVSGTVPVSGTFWQTTQPVSLASVPSHAVTNAGTFAVQVTSAPTTAVTGTFWQSTQPVSLAALPALSAGSNTIGSISNTSFAATQSGTWNIGTVTTLPALPAGSNIVGKVGIDQTTPGTTNGTQDASDGATGSAVPSKASYVGVNGSGNLTGLIQATASAPINVSTATTTQLVALSSGKAIYVTHWDIIAAAADNVTLEYGTGTACATGTTALTGAYNLPANGGASAGVGLAPILFVPASNALCIVTSAAGQASGAISYAQF